MLATDRWQTPVDFRLARYRADMYAKVALAELIGGFTLVFIGAAAAGLLYDKYFMATDQAPYG